MLKNLLFLLLLLFCFPGAMAQVENDSLRLKLNLRFAAEALQLNKTYLSEDTVTFTTVKFYISKIRLHFKDKSIFTEKSSFHLIDLENPKSQVISLCRNENKKIDKITFNIGIDSLTSTSGALEGDLDPANAMYWAWQSGYINLKVEGVSPSCITRKNAFQLHIGGYLPPYYALRQIELFPKQNSLSVVADLSKIFQNVKLADQNSIMIPGKEAMKIADYAAEMFTVE